MFENMRKAMLVGMGAAALSWEKMKESVDELVSKGDLTADEGKKLYNEMTDRAEQHGKEMDERVRTQVRQVLTNIGVADRAQISVLESRIEVLESRVNALEGQIARVESDVTKAQMAEA